VADAAQAVELLQDELAGEEAELREQKVCRAPLMRAHRLRCRAGRARRDHKAERAQLSHFDD
jgi:hypothetical protein